MAMSMKGNGAVTGTSPLSNFSGGAPFSLRSACSCCCAVPFQPIRYRPVPVKVLPSTGTDQLMSSTS